MDKSIKFFSISLIICVLLICLTIIFNGNENRYEAFLNGGILVIDKQTGSIYTWSSDATGLQKHELPK